MVDQQRQWDDLDEIEGVIAWKELARWDGGDSRKATPSACVALHLNYQ